MSKPTPAHHKTVRVTRATVAKGYGGVRKIKEAGPGLWEIVRAIGCGEDEKPAAEGSCYVVVAPARGVER